MRSEMEGLKEKVEQGYDAICHIFERMDMVENSRYPNVHEYEQLLEELAGILSDLGNMSNYVKIMKKTEEARSMECVYAPPEFMRKKKIEYLFQ